MSLVRDVEITPEEPLSTALELRRVRVQKTSVSVSDEIKRLIFSGALKPGDRLPPELELAERLGVSRQSVREALRGLELAGFLKVQRGGSGGRTIVDSIASSIGNSLLDAIQLSRITVDELRTARVELETVIVRHAAERADAEDLVALRENIGAAYRNLSEGVPATDTNLAFHKLIAKASKNQVLSLMLEALQLIMNEAVGRLDFKRSLEKSREFAVAHEGILEAIVARDPAAATARMRRHVVEVTKRLQEATPA